MNSAARTRQDQAGPPRFSHVLGVPRAYEHGRGGLAEELLRSGRGMNASIRSAGVSLKDAEPIDEFRRLLRIDQRSAGFRPLCVDDHGSFDSFSTEHQLRWTNGARVERGSMGVCS